MVKLNKNKKETFQDDSEYRRVTVFEMICPDCQMRVQVDGEDHRAEMHLRRFFGQLGPCPGSEKIVLGNRVFTHTMLQLIKNDKGRYYNPKWGSNG